MARIGGVAYYRLGLLHRDQSGATAYVSCKTGELLNHGDSLYAKELAYYFTNTNDENATDTELITHFYPSYSFIFKRLPVQRVNLENNDYSSATVDTAHSALAVRTKVIDIVENLIFLNLHKFHFMDPINKQVRDYISVIATLLMIVTTILGLLLMLKQRRATYS